MGNNRAQGFWVGCSYNTCQDTHLDVGSNLGRAALLLASTWHPKLRSVSQSSFRDLFVCRSLSQAFDDLLAKGKGRNGLLLILPHGLPGPSMGTSRCRWEGGDSRSTLYKGSSKPNRTHPWCQTMRKMFLPIHSASQGYSRWNGWSAANTGH